MVDPITMFKGGGPFMYAILGVALFAFGIAAERMYQIFSRYSLDSTDFMGQIQKLIMANNIDRAIKSCNEQSDAILPRIIKAGLTRANRSEKEIESAMEEAALEAGPLVNKRISFLSMLANVATLTGLLGTIMGLIQAFDAVANAPADMKQSMLASGISVAMFTTAGGLIVAIPTLILHSIIVNAANKILDDMDQYGLKTSNLLTARRRGTLQQESAKA